jgi:hypothetical protein
MPASPQVHEPEMRRLAPESPDAGADSARRPALKRRNLQGFDHH